VRSRRAGSQNTARRIGSPDQRFEPTTRRDWSLDRRVESRMMGSPDANQLDWSPERRVESRIMGSPEARQQNWSPERRVESEKMASRGRAAGREPRDVATTQEQGSISCFQIWNTNGGPGSWSPQAKRWLHIVLFFASANNSGFSDSSSSSSGGASMHWR
jgi:hypothetical protein